VSGITPLLDTLLHQVLGRRVDIPLPRDLNQPVGPPLASQASRAVEDDSRLEPRVPAVLYGGRPESTSVVSAASASSGESAAQHSPQSSVALSLSPAARVISEVLERFPQPPAAIVTSVPLLEDTSWAEMPVGLVASRLQDSVRQSGLFFESHVEQWFRGRLPFESLLREPQMSGVVVPVLPAMKSLSVAVDAMPASDDWVVAAPIGGHVDREGGEDGSPASLRADGAVLAGDSQAGDGRCLLVRHQLELLAAPQLRWEGSVWPGAFMTLAIEAPRDVPPQDLESAGDDREGNAVAVGEWCISLGLRLAGYGELDAVIRLHGDRLAVVLQSDQSRMRDHFEMTRDFLQKRLQDCGFSSVYLRLADTSSMSAEGHDV